MTDKPTYEDLEQKVKELEKELVKFKEGEGVLHQEKNLSDGIINSLPGLFYMFDEERFVRWNKKWEIITGYSPEELGRMYGPDFFEGADREHIVDRMQEVFREGASTAEAELVTKDGRRIPYYFSGLRVMFDGKPYLIGMGIDIADRKQAEEALRESEKKLRAIFDTVPDPILMYNNQGHPQYLNPAFTQIFGWPLDELHGGRIPFVPDDQKEITGAKIKELYDFGKPIRFESKRLTKEGQLLDVHISAAIIINPTGEPMGLVVNLTNITHRKSLEAQLQHAQKMEAIGTLAGGIAHNFNNLLMSIMGNASLLLMDIDSEHPHYENLKNIEKQVRKGSKLTAQLIGFARKGKYEVKPMSLNQLVKETSNTFGLARKDVMLHQELDVKLYGIKADQGQIEQTLLNLYFNAADAMTGGGNLFLKTQNVTHKDITGKPYDPKPGNYTLLTIRDDGAGMDKETMERIFEPFFTTKGLAVGTGLGLASAYGIIKSHGGYIDVDSEKGHGTTFSIYLPATKEALKDEKVLSGEIVKGKETVLLVDDEQIVLDTGGQILEKLGYEVLSATSGIEALELYEKNQDNIDMVLLDMVMPGMGGGETYDKMRQINSHVKVLLASGYSIDGEAKEILGRGCDGFIQKPFAIEEFSNEIRKVLDKD
ncbi:MAG: PAS domain S-box protein [Deltaproteobacteria bacterium]|nr:PAS domain S-box protein [Deltaproteobacteria bacterium]